MTSESVAESIRYIYRRCGVVAACNWAKERNIKPEFVINAINRRV